jgi:hypothetical protein
MFGIRTASFIEKMISRLSSGMTEERNGTETINDIGMAISQL